MPVLCGTHLRSSCADVNSHNKVVVCYTDGWAVNNPGNGEFLVEYIDPMLCTHIIYAFAELNNVTHSIQSSSKFIDTEEGNKYSLGNK
jgi:chitinase